MLLAAPLFSGVLVYSSSFRYLIMAH